VGQSDLYVTATLPLPLQDLLLATFGSREKADAWLRRPTTALAGDTPLSLLDTSEGALIVEDLLARIGHGLAT